MFDLNSIGLKKIRKSSNIKGDINKILSKYDPQFKGFGEIYTSLIKKDTIKAWKMHNTMTLNLSVIYGATKFVFFDGIKYFRSITIISEENHLLTVPPKVWYGFKSLNNKDSLILNLTDLVFDENEISRKNENEIEFDW